MGITNLDEIKAPQARVYIAGDLPTTAALYFGESSVGAVDVREFKGGELAFNTRDKRMYVQTATSGTTATWKRYPTILTAV